MIRPLRSVHRVVFFTLAIVLPFVLASGLLSRHRSASTPATSVNRVQESDVVVSEKTVLVNGATFTVRVLRDSSDPYRQPRQLIPKSPLVAPDVLVYWSEQRPESSLPAGALLLGPFRLDNHYLLPRDWEDKGFIILYSLPHRQIQAVIPLESQP